MDPPDPGLDGATSNRDEFCATEVDDLNFGLPFANEAEKQRFIKDCGPTLGHQQLNRLLKLGARR